MVQLNQHLRHYDLYCGAPMSPCVHNLCHVDSRDTMLRYSLNFGSNVINLPRVVCPTVCVPSPYSSIPREKRQSYVILIEFGWNGLKVSEVDNLENRKFIEAITSHPNF